MGVLSVLHKLLSVKCGNSECFHLPDYGDEGEDVFSGRKLSEKLYHGHREQQRVHIRGRGLQRKEKGRKTGPCYALVAGFQCLPCSVFPPFSGHYQLDRASKERTESQLCGGRLLQRSSESQ